jgi:hypothetical protein
VVQVVALTQAGAASNAKSATGAAQLFAKFFAKHFQAQPL